MLQGLGPLGTLASSHSLRPWHDRQIYTPLCHQHTATLLWQATRWVSTVWHQIFIIKFNVYTSVPLLCYVFLLVQAAIRLCTLHPPYHFECHTKTVVHEPSVYRHIQEIGTDCHLLFPTASHSLSLDMLLSVCFYHPVTTQPQMCPDYHQRPFTYLLT